MRKRIFIYVFMYAFASSRPDVNVNQKDVIDIINQAIQNSEKVFTCTELLEELHDISAAKFFVTMNF